MSKVSSILGSQPTNGKVSIGDKAPDFTLPDQSNHPIHFADLIGKGVTVLYFYPWDFTPGCTTEACAFRDSYEAFKDAGATVVGVSADSPESHQDFATRYALPFVLLSDRRGDVQKAYGLHKTFGLIPERVTFVIDRQGVVRHIFSSQRNAERHVSEALKVIHSLSADPSGQSVSTMS